MFDQWVKIGKDMPLVRNLERFDHDHARVLGPPCTHIWDENLFTQLRETFERTNFLPVQPLYTELWKLCPDCSTVHVHTSPALQLSYRRVNTLHDPVVWRPISVNPGLSFFCFSDNFPYFFQGIYSSSFRQKELTWICLLNFHIKFKFRTNRGLS